MILPIIDGWRLFAVQQLGLVIRMFSILMTAGTLFFLWGPVTHKTQYLQSVCWHIRASTRRLLPLLLTWYASPLNKHNARGRGTEPKQKRTLRGKGWKIQRNFMYFNYIQEPCFLGVKMFVCGTMFWRQRFLNPRFETTSWSQHRQEPIPLQTYGMNQFRFWMQPKSSLVWLWAKQKQTAKGVNTNTTLNHAVLTFDSWCKEPCFLLMASL